VQYESYYFGGNSKLPFREGYNPPVEFCLAQWFADDGAPLLKGFDEASDRLDKGLQIYFHQEPVQH
jgi:hypothetical protein